MYVFREELEGGHLCPCQHSSPEEVAFYPCHCIFTKMLIVDVIVTISFMIVIILIVAKCLALNLSCLLNEIYFHKFLNI